jgi:mannose-1-phosphate guanylyltransferase
MRVLLLAAGLGTRLKPITDTTPKCLVPIGKKPLLEIWLERLSEAGFGPFLINTHYLADHVKTYVEESPFRKTIKLVHEDQLLGTAGTLIENLKFFQGEDGMLIHADNYCMADFTAFKRAHINRPLGCLITMMTFRTDDPSSCGIVELDNHGIVVGFHEKVQKPPGNLANGAVYIISNELLTVIETELNYVKDFSTEVLHRFIGKIYTYETSEIFIDIGSIFNYKKINDLYK